MKRLSTMLIISGLVMTAGCNKNEELTGQVVATVDGEEITASQLDAELSDVRASSPEEQKELRRNALQQIINRYLMAKSAEDQNLTDTPAGAMAKLKAEQMAYISLLQQSVMRSVPKVSQEEAKQFALDNPDLFDRRKIFLVEQILIPTPPAAVIAELEPLNTMEQVQAALAKYKLPTRTTMGVIDSLAMEPGAVRQIAALDSAAVFILPKDDNITINQIRETRVEPVTGEEATRIASELLQNARGVTQMNGTILSVLQKGAAKVKYNKAMDLAPKQQPAVPAVKAASPPSQ